MQYLQDFVRLILEVINNRTVVFVAGFYIGYLVFYKGAYRQGKWDGFEKARRDEKEQYELSLKKGKYDPDVTRVAPMIRSLLQDMAAAYLNTDKDKELLFSWQAKANRIVGEMNKKEEE
jgi:hypothetical protein